MNERSFTLRDFAQVVLIVLVFCIVSTFLAVLGLGKDIETWFVKLVGKFDIFKVWFSLAHKLFNLKSGVEIQSVSDLAQLFNPPKAEVTGGFWDYIRQMGSVLALAFFDSFFSAVACVLLKSSRAFQRLPILADALGVTIGLGVSLLLKSKFEKSGLAYALVSLALLALGIFIMTGGKISHIWGTRREQNHLRYSFIGPVLFALPIPIATTGFATTACLVAAGSISFWYVFIAGVIYCLVLIYWEFIAVSLLQLRPRGN